MKNKDGFPDVKTKFDVIQGGRSKRFSEPLIEIPSELCNRINNEFKERLEVLMELLRIAGKSKEKKPFFSCIFTGEVREENVPTKEAIDSFSKALDIITDLGKNSDQYLLFALHDILKLADPRRIFDGHVGISQRIELDNLGNRYAAVVDYIRSKIIESFRQQLGITTPPFDSPEDDEGVQCW